MRYILSTFLLVCFASIFFGGCTNDKREEKLPTEAKWREVKKSIKGVPPEKTMKPIEKFAVEVDCQVRWNVRSALGEIPFHVLVVNQDAHVVVEKEVELKDSITFDAKAGDELTFYGSNRTKGTLSIGYSVETKIK